MLLYVMNLNLVFIYTQDGDRHNIFILLTIIFSYKINCRTSVCSCLKVKIGHGRG
ncbi:hypothetical protein DSUL_100198 [Desulfovibrionales bacterium]